MRPGKHVARRWAGCGAAGLVILCAAAGPWTAQPRAAEPVDDLLVLAADVSRSINDDEFQLQRKGYAGAIASQQVLNAIGAGEHHAIAVAFVEWAGEGEQKTVVEWSVVRDQATAQAFADRLLAAPRSFTGRTAIGAALDFALNVMGEAGYDAPRHVIDVSGDGTSNQGRAVTEARDAALSAGAIVNGLAIFNKRAAAMGSYLATHTNPPGGIAKYYQDNVTGGPGSFVEQIDDFNSFGEAMIRKLVSEIASAAPPGGAQAAGGAPG